MIAISYPAGATVTRHLFVTIIFAALCGACAPLSLGKADAAKMKPPAAYVDTAVAQELGPTFQGVVLMDAGSGPTVRAYGMARADTAVAAQADTRYQIGSVSKWITAAAVLRLVDRGLLALDTPIGAYLPMLPVHTGSTVTLRHLLSNTTGIPNDFVAALKQDASIADLPLTHLQASLRFAGGQLAFPAGSQWDYSPTNWIVVAAIIEHVTGMNYTSAVEQLVLAPAGVQSTDVPRTPFRDMPDSAWAYRNKQPWELLIPQHVVFVAASGTMYSTASDLAKLAQTVYETELLSAAARAELSRIHVPDQQYALGGRVKRLNLGGAERHVAWETGAIAGYKTVLAYVPREKKTVVILNNTDLPQADIARAAEALLARLYRVNMPAS